MLDPTGNDTKLRIPDNNEINETSRLGVPATGGRRRGEFASSGSRRPASPSSQLTPAWGSRPGRLGVFTIIAAALLGAGVTAISSRDPRPDPQRLHRRRHCVGCICCSASLRLCHLSRSGPGLCRRGGHCRAHSRPRHRYLQHRADPERCPVDCQRVRRHDRGNHPGHRDRGRPLVVAVLGSLKDLIGRASMRPCRQTTTARPAHQAMRFQAMRSQGCSVRPTRTRRATLTRWAPQCTAR